MSENKKNGAESAENSREKILLVGNPNVGKSVFFTELTGIHAVSSNFAGTTVSFMEGRCSIDGKEYTLIDVPGTYSVTPTSPAEEVATRFIQSGARAVICVLDASNLERNLNLALELQQYNIPTVYTLNLTDVAKRRGIIINEKLLSRELGAPVVSTVAVKNRGICDLRRELAGLLSTQDEARSGCDKCGSCPMSDSCSRGDMLDRARAISRRVSKKYKSEPSFIDKLGERMVKPFPGVPIALLVMVLVIGAVVGGGRALRAGIFLPLVNDLIVPFFRWMFTSIMPAESILRNVLIGEFGIFVISFEWILALIFPYVLLFYITFSFLEDSGYLPRLSVLFDNIMRKLGAGGGGLVYAMMGFGCAVPAIIGTRAATSRKERLVISAAVCFAIPCISQTGALISLFAGYSAWMLFAIMMFAVLLFVASAFIASKVVKGKTEPMLLEVPSLLLPQPKSYARKIATRMRHFLREAEIPMMIAVIIAAILKETGLLEAIAGYTQPLVSGWLGLPREAVTGLILGIVRREMSVAPLLSIYPALTPLQAFVGGVVSLMYIPCLSVFAILVREFKIKVAAVITVSTIVLALFVGGLINHIFSIFI